MKKLYIILIISSFVLFANAQSFSIGDNVQASSTTNVRDNAAGNLLGTHSSGDKGVIKAGPTIANLSGTSYTWYQVQWASSPTLGWSINTNLSKVTTGTVPSLPTNTSPGTTNSPGPTQSSSNVNLSWSASSGTSPITYEVAVTDLSSGSLVIDQYTTSTNYTANLQAGKPYRWNVQASNSIGKSAWTTVLYFQTPTTCTYSLSSYSSSPTSSAGTNTISVTANTGCSWTAVSSNTSWLTVTSGSSGSGNGTVTYSYSANTSTSSRTEKITVGGKDFTVTQAGASTSNAPTISFVSPSQPSATGAAQPFTINGSNFVSGCKVNLYCGTSPYLDRTQSSFSSTQITINPDFGSTGAQWYVEVVNPDGQTTVKYPFSVLTSTSCTGCVTCFGTELGTFNGVIAYSNCNANPLYVSNEYNDDTRIRTGMKWQCVEYVNRYYKIVYGLDVRGIKDSNGNRVFGDANSYYNKASIAGFTAYANGGSVAPQVGDILCSNGNSNNYGHVAIVKAVNSGSIDIIQQNLSNTIGGCYKNLTRTGNTVADFGTGLPVTGWLRYQGSTTNTPTITNVSPSLVPAKSISSGYTLITINGANFLNTATLVFKDPNKNPYSSRADRLTWVNSGQITYEFYNDNAVGDWTVRVDNGNGQISNAYTITVTPSSSGSKIYGIDISHWNTNDNNSQINWEQVYNDGKLFAYIKGTGGKNYIDPWFNKAITSPNPKKVILGAYHFAYPTYYTPEEEAQHFLDYASAFIGFGFLPPALDIEDDLGNSSVLSTLSADVLTNWVQRWLTAVENSPLNPNHIKPIVYTSSLTYAPVLKSSLSSYNLWVANTIGCDPNSNPSTGNWTDWKFHQYVDPTNLPCKTTVPNCAGFSTPVDLDVFNGDINALNALVGLGSGVFDLEHQNNLNIYPNPATTAINIKIPNIDNNLTVEVVSLQGAVLYSNKYNVQQDDVLNVNVSNLSKGIYIIKLNGNNNIGTAKIIKE